MDRKIKVMMTTEGTYPFHQGGVSTWSDTIVKNINAVDFYVYSIIMDPFVTQKFTLPYGVKLIKLPLWGTEEPGEHLERPFSEIYMSKQKTTDKIIRERFIPCFTDLILGILDDGKDPKVSGETIVKLYEYFQEYEYKQSFKSEITWNVYKQIIQEYVAGQNSNVSMPNVFSMIQSLGWVYRFMNILNTPIPQVDVCHSSAAAFCGLPCVIAKLKYGSAFLLTEHGVYLREQYLSLARNDYPAFLSEFLIKLVRFVTSLNFYYADQVSPVCNYNTRWEREFGVEKKRIRVLYNGVNANVFKPSDGNISAGEVNVVAIARIDPIKDILMLIKAAGIVTSQRKNVKFTVYGSVSVPGYFEKCKEMVQSLNLKDKFIFAGHINDVPSAYAGGDIVALSSISEAFPYSVVEAMMSGKAVVATDVGGVAEALGDTGLLVSPKNEKEMAQAIIKLADNPSLRETFGIEARERALNYFSINRMLENYIKTYILLASRPRKAEIRSRLSSKNAVLLIHKADALFENGFYKESIVIMNQIIEEVPVKSALPYLLSRISLAYERMGDRKGARNEAEKAVAFESLINGIKIA